MNRVRTVHFTERVLSTPTLSVGIFILALWGIGREVWVSHVFHNAPSLTDVVALTRFYVYAFLDTRLPVQALSIIALGALVWLGYSIVRNLQEVRFPQFAH